jgi:hypothetical protein
VGSVRKGRTIPGLGLEYPQEVVSVLCSLPRQAAGHLAAPQALQGSPWIACKPGNAGLALDRLGTRQCRARPESPGVQHGLFWWAHPAKRARLISVVRVSVQRCGHPPLRTVGSQSSARSASVSRCVGLGFRVKKVCAPFGGHALGLPSRPFLRFDSAVP